MEVHLGEIILLCIAAFAAGFVDAIVGGGGLIQTPAALVILPNFAVVNIIGSMKIPAFSGTAIATARYMRKVPVRWPLITIICVIAFFASFAGSQLLTVVSNQFMKPVLLIVLSGVAIYTFARKNFGQKASKKLPPDKELTIAIITSLILGFYDGFIGPGTGSFLILTFISLLGFDFLKASAHAKMVNLSTNLGSIFLFFIKGKIIWAIALPMAVSNALGGYLGANLAIAKGNKFIRVFFLCVVVATLLRFMYDVLLR